MDICKVLVNQAFEIGSSAHKGRQDVVVSGIRPNGTDKVVIW